MLPLLLMPESIHRQGGFGPEIEIPFEIRKILVKLGVTRIIERESLDIAVWGSADKSDWGAKPLVHFPQKFYCGTYSLLLDLTNHPAVRYLRVQYKLNQWGRRDERAPLFGFFVSADAALEPTSARAVA
jgi:hypothetical protein